jgi:hypothetical protein
MSLSLFRQRSINNKRAHAEKRRSSDYNKVSHNFLELIVESPAQLHSKTHWSALSIREIELAGRRITETPQTALLSLPVL